MYEKTIQELAEREPAAVFPGMGLRLVGRQVVVSGGAADLLMADESDAYWVVELKRDTLQPPHVEQVLRYGAEIRTRHPGRSVSCLIAGPAVGRRTREVARARGVEVLQLDMVVLQRLAEAHGVRDGAARPRRAGSVERPSRPRGPGAQRHADPDRVRHQQELDAAFPPGTLTASSAPVDLARYWAAASPSAAPGMRDVAVQLSFGVLAAVPGAALSNRASSWTCFRRGDGLVIASMEPKRDRCHMSFLLPDDVARDLAADGLVTPHQVRNGGTWVNCRQVMARVTCDQALTWYRLGLDVLDTA